MGRFGSKRAKFRPPKLLIKKIYKVTDVEVIEDLMGRLQFKIQLNNELWVTKKWQHDTFCGMHKIYINNGGSVNSLIGKYICVSIYDDPAGYTAEIDSYDVFISFAKKLENSGGTTFTTTIPIYSFLKEIGRNVEDDATIKIKSNFGDMRVCIFRGKDLCYRHDTSNQYLNLENINIIFEQFYKNVRLPARCPHHGEEMSYYKISIEDPYFGIVRMDHQVNVCYRLTSKPDSERWDQTMILKLGGKLLEEHLIYLHKINNK